MTRLTIVLAATLTLTAGLSACAQNTATQLEDQPAIEGATLLTPCPVEISDIRCPLTPVSNVTLLFERDEKEVARIKTGPHGRYQLEVSPGTYRVSTVPGSPAFTKLPFEVHVYEGETSRAYFPLSGGPICGGECLTPSPDSG